MKSTINTDIAHQRYSFLLPSFKGIQLNKLRHAWNSHSIDRCDQILVEQYLTYYPEKEFNEQIQLEIERIKKRESLLHKLSEVGLKRNIVLQELSKKITFIETRNENVQSNMSQLCILIHRFRQINLLFAQTLLAIHNYFRKKMSLEGQEIFCTKMVPLFEQFQHIDFLSKSFLRKYIVFSHSFDPFFLKHHELLKKTNNYRLKRCKAVQQLFNISQNELERFYSIQNQIKLYLTTRVVSKHSTKELFKKLEQKTPKEVVQKRRRSWEGKLTNKRYLNCEKQKQQNRNVSLPKNLESYVGNKMKPNKNELFQFPPLSPIQPKNRKRSQFFPANQRETNATEIKSFSAKIKNIFEKDPGSNDDEEDDNGSFLKNRFSRKFETQRSQESRQKERKYSKLKQIKESRQKGLQSQRTSLQNPHLITKISSTERNPPKIENKLNLIQKRKSNKTVSQQKQKVRKLSLKQKSDLNIEIVPQEVSIIQLFNILKQVKIKKEYRSKCQIGSWQNSMQHNQFYFHKIYMSRQLLAISLCCGLPDGDVNIKYWGPFDNCDQTASNLLFQKYVEYLQMNTTLKTIFFNAFFIKQLALNQFIKKKQRIYQRQRINPLLIQEQQYTYFLSINFTNIAIPKQTPAQQQLIVQDGIQPFDAYKFIIFNYLLIVSKLVEPGAFSNTSTYTPKVADMKGTKKCILSQYLPNQAYNPTFKSNFFNLLTFKLNTPIKSAYFISDNNSIKMTGEICYEDQDSIIVCIPMYKNSTKLYFGKGIKNAFTMIQKVKKSSMNQKISICLPMFKKKLRGQINSINLKEENCFGDLTVSFQWKDYLKGKIKHPMDNCEQTFISQFYCLVEMQKELLFVFEVTQQDLI